MTVRIKLSQQSFIKANIAIAFSKFWYKILAIGYPIACLMGFIFSSWTGKPSAMPLIIAILIPTFSIAPIYYLACKNYRTQDIYRSYIDYAFLDSSLKISGAAFNAEINWTNIQKTTQTRNWVLIWQTSQLANPIPKSELRPNDLEQIRSIAQKNGVSNNLW